MIRSDADLQTLRFPLGQDNTTPENRLTPGAAREVLNLDVRTDGSLVTRQGQTKVLNLTDGHSAWADPDFPYLLVRDGERLLALDPALEAVEVAAQLGDGETSYCELNGEALFTVEGIRTGRIDSLLDVRPLGLPTPAGVPALTATLFGGLAEGTYQVALSFLDAAGQESGLSEPRTITVPENAAIAVTLPPAPAGAAFIRVYASEPDGSELWHVFDVDALLNTATFGAGARGDAAETAGLRPLPPGHILRELNGIPWMAYENWLLHGLPMRPFLTKPASAWLSLKARIDLLEPVGDGETAGLFVAAGKRTYYFAGGVPGKQSQKVARAHGAVPGSGCVIDGEPFGIVGAVAAWIGLDGTPCLGLPGGSVRLLAKRAAMTAGMERGALLLREANGIRSLLAVGRGGSQASFAASATAEVYQYRNGKPVP